MKKSRIIVGIVALLIAAGGAFLLLSGKKETTTNDSAQTTPASTQSNSQSTSYTAEQVSEHSTQGDCWTIVNKSVYNITAYVPQHPGGISEITKICGKDGTSLFEGNREHDATADTQLARLKIGTLAQ